MRNRPGTSHPLSCLTSCASAHSTRQETSLERRGWRSGLISRINASRILVEACVNGENYLHRVSPGCRPAGTLLDHTRSLRLALPPETRTPLPPSPDVI